MTTTRGYPKWYDGKFVRLIKIGQLHRAFKKKDLFTSSQKKKKNYKNIFDNMGNTHRQN